MGDEGKVEHETRKLAAKKRAGTRRNDCKERERMTSKEEISMPEFYPTHLPHPFMTENYLHSRKDTL